MASSKNYSGRTVDLSLFPEIAVSGVPVLGRLTNNSRAIAGPSKVAQNFVRILLTPLGKYRAYPTLGSSFLSRIQNGSVRSSIDLLHLFSGESLEVVSFMNAVTPTDAPLDERIASVELTNYSADRGSFYLNINLTTQAGVGTDFLLPVVWNN